MGKRQVQVVTDGLTVPLSTEELSLLSMALTNSIADFTALAQDTTEHFEDRELNARIAVELDSLRVLLGFGDIDQLCSPDNEVTK